jgi:hypothetical protein
MAGTGGRLHEYDSDRVAVDLKPRRSATVTVTTYVPLVA